MIARRLHALCMRSGHGLRREPEARRCLRRKFGPRLTATAAQLIAAYNAQASAIRTMNATVRMTPVAGSAYSGVIQQYHEVGGFILAARPAMIRVIGQAPVVAKNIFDMVSDGADVSAFLFRRRISFWWARRVWSAPPKNPIENLRPQHILDALFWPELPPARRCFSSSLTRLRTLLRADAAARSGDSDLEIERKIWFDRATCASLACRFMAPRAGWTPISPTRIGSRTTRPRRHRRMRPRLAAGRPPASLFPRDDPHTRPQQDYQLAITSPS